MNKVRLLIDQKKNSYLFVKPNQPDLMANDGYDQDDNQYNKNGYNQADNQYNIWPDW